MKPARAEKREHFARMASDALRGADTLPVYLLDPFHWISPVGLFNLEAGCPTCCHGGEKPIILRTAWPGRASDAQYASLLFCPHCRCGFFHPASTAEYEIQPPGGNGALAFYLQQGAGLWGITANLQALRRPAGTCLLEVGCGFGFGLDFARRALGWEVAGLDPSPIAAAGRDALNLPIESRYLTLDDPALSGRFDVVMASEVLEHLPSPREFIQLLRSALRDGGSLVLTTPDMEAVTKNTPSGLLVPLLSVGYHLVLQNKSSLTNLLLEAGFTEVDVQRTGGASLVARCRLGPPAAPATGQVLPTVDERSIYRQYLLNAATMAEAGTDLWFGLSVRAYREAVNAADKHVANTVWEQLSGSCMARFGSPPEHLAHRPDGRETETLEVLALIMPLCLGPLLLHRAFHRLLAGEQRAEVEKLFVLAGVACERLRSALQRIGSDDGDAEDIAWIAGAEAILCVAERGGEGVPEQLQRNGIHPADAAAGADGRSGRTAAYRRRAFVTLVNSGRLLEADQLSDVIDPVEVRVSLPNVHLADDELDVLFCAAVRELQRKDIATNAAASAERALDLLGKIHIAYQNSGRTSARAPLEQPVNDAEAHARRVLANMKGPISRMRDIFRGRGGKQPLMAL